jgi:hypothetical protein
MGHIAVYNATARIPADKAWQNLRDLSLGNQYVPGINKCVVTTEKKEGVGASRRVSGPQQALDETVVEWNEGRGFHHSFAQWRQAGQTIQGSDVHLSY